MATVRSPTKGVMVVICSGTRGVMPEVCSPERRMVGVMFLPTSYIVSIKRSDGCNVSRKRGLMAVKFWCFLESEE